MSCKHVADYSLTGTQQISTEFWNVYNSAGRHFSFCERPEIEIRCVERGICLIAAILEFYLRCGLVPSDRHRHFILYRCAEFCPSHHSEFN